MFLSYYLVSVQST